MVYQHHSAPLIKHSAPFEGSRYHDSNSNFSDLSFHHPKWLQPYVFPSFLGRLTRKKTDHFSVHTNPKVGRFRFFFWLVWCWSAKTHTHTPLSRNAFHGMDVSMREIGRWFPSVSICRRKLRFVLRWEPNWWVPCLCWNKNGDWQGGDVPTFSP